MAPSRKMLYQTLVGHFALLQSAHPRKAASNVAKRARRHVKMSLRQIEPMSRRLAA